MDNPFPGNPLNEELEKMYIPDCFAEKFAELIIQKCITKIALIGIHNFKTDDIMWTVETAIANIKEHFGVEEYNTR